MSYPAMAWARTIKTGSATNKSVLLAVANYANEEGVCWPSQERLAEDTELSRRSIMRALDDLEAAGHITRERRHRSDGSRKTDLITLCLCDTKAPSKNDQCDTAPSQCDTVSKPKCHSVTAEPFIEPTIEPSSISSDADFEEFWAAYPKRPNNPRKKAMAAYRKARKNVSQKQLLTAVGLYAAYMAGENPKFIAMASTWLNEERWNCDYSKALEVTQSYNETKYGSDVDLDKLAAAYPGYVGDRIVAKKLIAAEISNGATLDALCEAAQKYKLYCKGPPYEDRKIAPAMLETWLKFKWREMDGYEFCSVGPDRIKSVRPKKVAA